METKKNEDGTYEVVLGNTAMRNANGLVFPAEMLRNAVVRLNERAKRGAACAELGFPRRHPGEDPSDFQRRILTIEMDRVGARFTEFRLESASFTNPRIVAQLVPTGPCADQVRRALDGEVSGYYFGMRAFADTKVENGVLQQHIRDIVTFDLVSEKA